jgi:hypothetical protein
MQQESKIQFNYLFLRANSTGIGTYYRLITVEQTKTEGNNICRTNT